MNNLPQTKPKIYIATDHAGFELKNQIVDYLKQQGYEIKDYGNSLYDPHDDYTDFVVPLAINMQKDLDTSHVKGIVLCRNGVGVGMVVNKFKGLRASISFSVRHIISAINDDNANVLALPVDYISKEEAFDIVKEFLHKEFSNEERHIKRLNKVKDLGM
jgi:ribose 5-phosphate isomerase B